MMQRMGVRWTFSDRYGGVGSAPYATLNLAQHVGDDPASVVTNRGILEARLGPPGLPLVFMDQVHGDRVAVVDLSTTDPPQATDGMVTAALGIALAVMVADCVPVLMADAEAGVVAAVHVGRPGLRSQVVLRALEAMARLGASRTRTVAWLGPSVCADCYEVPADMRADVASVVPAAWSTSRSGTPALDLRAGLTAELAGAGVTVTSVGGCTAESPDHFSYRRDHVTGRFAGVVWLEP
jgi:polyphenol oxidase